MEQYVAGLVTGPPCETWSAARDVELPAGTMKRPPRPLRKAWSVWCMPDLSRKEFVQVLVGNTLMGFSLKMMVLQATNGAYGLLEHPADPKSFRAHKPDAASIWSTEVMRWLRETFLFCFLTCQQGHFGAKSRKPTTFLLAGVEEDAAKRLEVEYRTTPLPDASSIGLDSWGWKTSSLKEYPADLCTLIAATFDTWLQKWLHRQAEEQVRAFNEDAAWVKDLIVTEEDSDKFFGPDFNPTVLPCMEFTNTTAKALRDNALCASESESCVLISLLLLELP